MSDTQQDIIRPYGPGKFDTYIDSYVYDASLDGCDEECGESETTGWYGLVTGDSVKGMMACVPDDVVVTDAEREFLQAQAGAIISENSVGFVSVEYYEDANALTEAYRAIESEVNEDEANPPCRLCGEPTDDGEGYDGLCGECADKAEDAEPQEPSEGDLATEDWIKFYEVGGRGVKVEVAEDEDWQDAVSACMEREQFWPNVWSLSDHGNWCLLSLDKEAE